MNMKSPSEPVHVAILKGAVENVVREVMARFIAAVL